MSGRNGCCGPCPDLYTSIVDQDRHFIIDRQDSDNEGGRHTRFGPSTRHQSHLVLHRVSPIVVILEKKDQKVVELLVIGLN